MKIILYVNSCLCINIDELRKYFMSSLTPGDSLYEELLTLYKDDIITEWLEEGASEEEKNIAKYLRTIPKDLSNSELMERLIYAFTNKNVTINKPDFLQYVDIESLHFLREGERTDIRRHPEYEIEIEESDFWKKTNEVEVEMRIKRIDNENFIIKLQDEDSNLYTESSFSITGMKVDDTLVTKLSFPLIKGGKHRLSIMSGIQSIHSFNVLVSKNETFLVNGVEFKMIHVKKDNNHDYKIGETPVTQELWNAIMGNNPSFHIKKREYGTSIWSTFSTFINNLGEKIEHRPVESVSFEECRNFVMKLNELTGRKFRIPTETEWRYAAWERKYQYEKNRYLYSGSFDIEEVAWYNNNSSDITHPVGYKKPNKLGIYDMSGNVEEWCENDNSNDDIINCFPILGGSYASQNWGCSIGYSNCGRSDFKSRTIGFRLAL